MGTISSSRTRSKFLLAAAFILIWLSFGVRLHDLGSDSFWFDEVLTVGTAQRGVAAALAEVGHPPLHYLFVREALKLFGETEFAARLPSAFAGVFAVPLLILWGKRMRRPFAGSWTALFLALSPFHLRYSQEARHYTWFMLFSLASYLILDWAMAQRQWRWWLLFALLTVVNLYVHYAALVVLASQTLIIGGWIWVQWRQQERRALLFPVVAALMVLVLYSMQLPDLLFALNWNLGTDAGQGGQNIDSLWSWIHQVFFTFGASTGLLPYLMMILVVVGLAQLVQNSQWHLLALVGGGIILPILFIAVLKVDRPAEAKYVIYIFPLYLFAAGVGLDAILEYGRQRWEQHGRYISPTVSLFVILAFTGSSWPLLQKEYHFIERDWLGVANTLRPLVEDNDVVISFTLDLSNGFNAGKLMMPYYLNRERIKQTIYSMQDFKKSNLDNLFDTGTKVRAVILNRNTPMILEDDEMLLMSFQGSLFLLEIPDSSEPVLEQLIYLYEQLIPLAGLPSPQCLLSEDLALLYAQKSHFLTADRLFVEAQAACPWLVNGQYPGYDLLSTIQYGLIDYHQQQGDVQAARQEAFQILSFNTKDKKALEVVTAVNLFQVFEDDNAIVNTAPGVEPIQIRQYTMPHNGDWGDVLLIHPPNSLSFPIKLPDEATDLHFRAAMAPESWEWGGDGSTFVVLAETETQPATELFRWHVSNDPSGQDWHEITVPLTEFTGQNILLTLATEPGPAGDTTGDWAGWETPRIIYRANQ